MSHGMTYFCIGSRFWFAHSHFHQKKKQYEKALWKQFEISLILVSIFTSHGMTYLCIGSSGENLAV